ncbi:FUT10 fucosyltransferase, partial [Acromyrmex heyeri]
IMPRKIRVMFTIATALSVCLVIFQLCLILRDRKRLSFSGNLLMCHIDASPQKLTYLDFLYLDDDVPVILWWTPFGNNNRVKTCGNARCYLTHNRTFENDVNLKSVLFYGSNLRIHDLPSWRSSAISWGLLHEESPRNNPILVHEEALNLFNYSSTFSRLSNVPLTLLDLSGLEELVGNYRQKHTRYIPDLL